MLLKSMLYRACFFFSISVTKDLFILDFTFLYFCLTLESQQNEDRARLNGKENKQART